MEYSTRVLGWIGLPTHRMGPVEDAWSIWKARFEAAVKGQEAFSWAGTGHGGCKGGM